MQVSNNVAGEIHPIDEFGRQGVEAFAAPLMFARDGVKEIAKAFTPGEYKPRKFTNDTPTILQLAHQVIDFYGSYHTNVLRNSFEYAGRVERLVEGIIKLPLTPLTFTETGTSIQKVLCETIIGTLVFATIYCALQIFHIVPTIITAVVLSTTVFMYHTAPVALITAIVANILLLMVYCVYYLKGEVNVGNRTLQKGFEDAQKKILEVQGQVRAIENLVVNTIVPTVKLAAITVLTLSIASTTAIMTVAYYVLTNKTV